MRLPSCEGGEARPNGCAIRAPAPQARVGGAKAPPASPPKRAASRRLGGGGTQKSAGECLPTAYLQTIL